MIWLTTLQNSDTLPLYFDVRDVSLNYRDDSFSALVQGVVGDGFCEIGGEVALGDSDRVTLLPVLNEQGAVETLSEEIDEGALSRLLLSEVKRFLRQKGLLRGRQTRHDQAVLNPHTEHPGRLAA